MAWAQKSVAQAGEYLLFKAKTGLNFDLFASVTDQEILDRVANYAHGWHPISVTWDRGAALGFGSTLALLGAADTTVAPQQAGAEFDAAINSFWTLAFVASDVWVGDSASAPAPGGNSLDTLSTSARWISAALIVIGVAIIVAQLRKAAA